MVMMMTKNGQHQRSPTPTKARNGSSPVEQGGQHGSPQQQQDPDNKKKRQQWTILRTLLLSLFAAALIQNAGFTYISLMRAVNVAIPESGDGFGPDEMNLVLSNDQLQQLDVFRKEYLNLQYNHTGEPSPYYQYGKFQYQFFHRYPEDAIENRKILNFLKREEPSHIGRTRVRELFAKTAKEEILEPQLVTEESSLSTDTDTWVLPIPLKHPTRNHDTILIEEANDDNNFLSIQAIHLLGRHSRYVQSTDVLTGQQKAVRTKEKTDPDGMPLDDLNHVSAVLVDKLDDDGKTPTGKKEIWLPCGFHNDPVNSEVSTNYVRIVDVETLKVRVGPKLPISGGACVATALTIIENEPPMICSFGGTQGTHDRGKFLKETACYDRIRKKWWSPFGDLPYGLDHGSLAVLPPGQCQPDDPGRLVVLNFRTKPYGDAHAEMLVHDMKTWTLKELKEQDSAGSSSDWYVYYDGAKTDSEDVKNIGRDASGIVVADGGRHIVNFGGTYHYNKSDDKKKKKRVRGRFSMIRSFDVCRKEWNVVGDLGLRTFALQTAASDQLQIALTCGGEAPMKKANGHWCFVTKFHNGMRLSNRYGNTVA